MSTNNAFIVFIVGTLIIMLFALTLVIFLIVHKKKRFGHLLEKQQMESTYQNQLIQSRLEAQQQSFKYFSEEIHDNVGQLLSVVGMQLYQIEQECTGTHSKQLAAQSTELLNKAIDDLRTISHTLDAGYVSKAGLVESLRKEIAYINSIKAVDCRLEIKE